ncbi:MAG: protein-glutamate O-methyltransferase CheR [Anaerolineae bacterium]|nr:protein-glutamate O-methyltransferase CheR [Anaerolineae bacterium]
MKKSDIEDIEIALFLEALYQRYDYDFKNYAKASLRRRIRHFLASTPYTQISEMIPHLLYDEAFAQSAMQDFSIMVTEMFRDPTFYAVVREKVIPYLKTYPFMKVWHAGCATGEEVYSLAIVLKEEGVYDRATIFATDFNDAALQTAREGIYPLKDIRLYTKNYQLGGGARSFADYYHAQYESAIMDQALKKNVTFANHNLVTDGVFSEVHLIFCRNVLIYFDKTLQNRVLKLFSDSLSYGGFLCLGTKETLQFSDVQDRFKVIDPREKIYQKIVP